MVLHIVKSPYTHTHMRMMKMESTALESLKPKRVTERKGGEREKTTNWCNKKYYCYCRHVLHAYSTYKKNCLSFVIHTFQLTCGALSLHSHCVHRNTVTACETLGMRKRSGKIVNSKSERSSRLFCTIRLRKECPLHFINGHTFVHHSQLVFIHSNACDKNEKIKDASSSLTQ